MTADCPPRPPSPGTTRRWRDERTRRTEDAKDRRVGWVGLEVVAATAAALLDLLIPALVNLAPAALSPGLRRERPASLGFHRLASPLRTAGAVALLVAAWSLLLVGLAVPVLERVTGHEQDFGVFADLQGDVGLLVTLVVASWLLGALVEETRLRGFVITRLAELLGGPCRSLRLERVFAVVGSAVLFALIHTEQGVVGVAVTFLDGLFLGVATLPPRQRVGCRLGPGFANTLGLLVFFTFDPVGGLW